MLDGAVYPHYKRCIGGTIAKAKCTTLTFRIEPALKEDLRAAALPVFEGDTLIACAHFDQSLISGSVVLEVETEKGEVIRHELLLPMPPMTENPDRLSTIARLAASARMKEFDDRAGLAIALHYRLVSPWTNWLVIDERSDKEKAEDLPSIRKVPQTMAAGSHGVGTVHSCMRIAVLPDTSAMFISRVPDFVVGVDFKASLDSPSIRLEINQNIPEPFRRLIDLIENQPTRLELRGAIDLLQEAGLRYDFEDLFRQATDLGLNADMIAVIVLAELLGGRLGEYLSDELESTVKSLQKHAQLAKKDMLELGRLGIALARTVENSLSHEVLRPEQAHEIRERLERFGSFRGLFDHLQDYTRRSAEKIPMYRMVTGHTLEDVRKQFDITRERLRQTEVKASGELRHQARRGSK